jgi:hypothetical protein
MADLKFLCPLCGQRLSCDAQRAGQQIECPGCQSVLVVPTPSSSAPPTPRAAQPKLSPAQRPFRRHKTNLIPTYGFATLIIGALLWAGYTLLPALTNGTPAPKAPEPAATTATATTPAGPMGDVSGAMDVSSELDGDATRRNRAAHLLTGTNSTSKR